jgi:hypothetical protein
MWLREIVSLSEDLNFFLKPKEASTESDCDCESESDIERQITDIQRNAMAKFVSV